MTEQKPLSWEVIIQASSKFSQPDVEDQICQTLNHLPPEITEAARSIVLSHYPDNFNLQQALPLNMASFRISQEEAQVLHDQMLADPENVSLRVLAEAYGCSISTIHRTFEHYGLALPPSKMKTGNTSDVAREIYEILISNPQLSFEDVGRIYNISGAAISHRLKVWGYNLPRDRHIERQPTIKAVDVVLITELLEADPPFTRAQIAEKFGIAASTLDAYFTKYGIRMKSKILGRETTELIYQRLNAGDTFQAIADDLEMNVTTIKHALEVYGYYESNRFRLESQIEQLLSEGKDYIQIKRLTNVSAKDIRTIADRLRGQKKRLQELLEKDSLLNPWLKQKLEKLMLVK